MDFGGLTSAVQIFEELHLLDISMYPNGNTSFSNLFAIIAITFIVY